jgi:hypothetical protein
VGDTHSHMFLPQRLHISLHDSQMTELWEVANTAH